MLDLRRTCQLQTFLPVSPRHAVSNLPFSRGAKMTNIHTIRRLRTPSRRPLMVRVEPVLLDRPIPILSRADSYSVRPTQMLILEPRQPATRRVDARRLLPYRALCVTLRRTHVRSAARLIPKHIHTLLIMCNLVTIYQKRLTSLLTGFSDERHM